MSKIDRPASIKKFIELAQCVQFESDEDEGAAEYQGQIEEVIYALQDLRIWDIKVIDIASDVGLDCKLVFTKDTSPDCVTVKGG